MKKHKLRNKPSYRSISSMSIITCRGKLKLNKIKIWHSGKELMLNHPRKFQVTIAGKGVRSQHAHHDQLKLGWFHELLEPISNRLQDLMVHLVRGRHLISYPEIFQKSKMCNILIQ